MKDLEKLVCELADELCEEGACEIKDHTPGFDCFTARMIRATLEIALKSERERTARRCAEIAADDSWIEDNIKKEFSL